MPKYAEPRAADHKAYKERLHHYERLMASVLEYQQSCRSKQGSMNYCHYAVNHCISFVNPENRWVHTQTVERFWGDFKHHISGRGKGLKIEQNVYRYLFLKLNKISFIFCYFSVIQCRKSFRTLGSED